MAVTEKAQGLGIGKILIEHCLDFARNRQIQETDIILQYPIGICHSFISQIRFEEVELESGLYERANIKMELRIE